MDKHPRGFKVYIPEDKCKVDNSTFFHKILGVISIIGVIGIIITQCLV